MPTIDEASKRKRFLLGGVFFFLYSLSSPSFSQLPDEDQRGRGLQLTITAPDGTAIRRSGAAARRIGEPLDPRVPRASSAVWSGWLQSQADGAYRLAAHATGQLRVSINGKLVIDMAGHGDAPKWVEAPPFELEYGLHPITIEHRSGNSSPRLLLYWAGPGFQLEPLPTKQLFSERLASSDAAAVDRGADLYQALRCAACHDLPNRPSFVAAPAPGSIGGLPQTRLVGRLAVKSQSDRLRSQNAAFRNL